MLCTNKTLKIIEKGMSFGPVTGVALGEYGRGRREIFLPTPNGVEGTILGLRKDLTIGTSKSGRPRISRAPKDDEELYIILSTERNYTRRGNGYIRVPKTQELCIIARGNGADGAAGRVGHWDVVIFKAKDGDVFRVAWGGYGYGYPATFYVVHGDKVYQADQPEVEDLYEAVGVEMPFTLKYDGNELVTNLDEWLTV